jgi:membrane fusion protein (multidrug efflux system)
MTVKQKKEYKKVVIGGLIIIIAIISLYSYFKYDELYPSTDDAYVEANLVNVASKVSGYLTYVKVKDNQMVHKGEVIFTVESKDFELAQNQAYQNYLAQIAQTKALLNQLDIQKKQTIKDQKQYEFLKTQKIRYTNLYNANTISKQAYQNVVLEEENAKTGLSIDAAKYNQLLNVYKLTQAKESGALASLNQANLNLSYTTYISPIDGYITNLGALSKGEFIANGTPLFGIVNESEWWISANFKETQLSRIRENQPVTIKLDMYDHTFQGQVQSISYASGNTFSLLPAQNATGNWVKITQRFLVKIKVTSPSSENYPLRVGASAKVTIDTSGKVS